MQRFVHCILLSWIFLLSGASFINKKDTDTASSTINQNFTSGIGDSCSSITPTQRIDCYPENGSNQATCQARGCCWATFQGNYKRIPYCFYPTNFPTYSIVNVTQTGTGYAFGAVRTVKSFRPNDILVLNGTMNFYQGGLTRLTVFHVLHIFHSLIYSLF